MIFFFAGQILLSDPGLFPNCGLEYCNVISNSRVQSNVELWLDFHEKRKIFPFLPFCWRETSGGMKNLWLAEICLLFQETIFFFFCCIQTRQISLGANHLNGAPKQKVSDHTFKVVSILMYVSVIKSDHPLVRPNCTLILHVCWSVWELDSESLSDISERFKIKEPIPP